MFCKCEKLSYINVSGFDTSSANSIEKMFYNCSGLLSVDVTNFNNTDLKNTFT